MGFRFDNFNGVFVVRTPEGKLMGTNSGLVLEYDHGEFKLSADVFSCSFTFEQIDKINDVVPDPDKVFFQIIKLFPK